MVGRGNEKPLRRGVVRSGYVVDPRAVAEAMLRSGMFVAAQPRYRPVRAEKDEAATG
jgi:hypothetical protein